MMALQPVSATLFAYQVGFGDCFLLRFTYSDQSTRHVLIDFGTTGLPKGTADAHLLLIAKDIEAQCGGQLDAVVATHRHADHISGFATAANGNGPGDVIRALKPRLVLQPWTEDLKLAVDSKGPAGSAAAGRLAAAKSLREMQQVAEHAVAALDRKPSYFNRKIAAQIRFIGEDNLSNASAVRNLSTMGRKNVYAYHESDSGLELLLPGIKVHVLGPPTLHQSEAIRKQRSVDPAEYWHLQSRKAADIGAQVGDGGPVFADHVIAKGGKLPAHARWLAYRMKEAQGEQLLQIVRALDKQMNNTSLILLFETQNKKLLFPGDAQIENWSVALSKEKYLDLLADVDLYKVGHHGSLNATPKTMWNRFTKKGKASKPGRMQSVLSTMPHKHGSEDAGTEVPRIKLIKSLQSQTNFHATTALGAGDLYVRVEIKL